MNLRRLLLLSVLSLPLLSCGFQPRGSLPLAGELPLKVKLTGLGDSHAFARILKDELKAAGASLVEADNADNEDQGEPTEPVKADVRVKLIEQKSERFTLSLDSRAKTVEYEIRETLRFMFKRDGKSSGERLLVARRILFNPDEQLLGRTREEKLLKSDMHHELSRHLINQLAASQ